MSFMEGVSTVSINVFYFLSCDEYSVCGTEKEHHIDNEIGTAAAVKFDLFFNLKILWRKNKTLKNIMKTMRCYALPVREIGSFHVRVVIFLHINGTICSSGFKFVEMFLWIE